MYQSKQRVLSLFLSIFVIPKFTTSPNYILSLRRQASEVVRWIPNPGSISGDMHCPDHRWRVHIQAVLPDCVWRSGHLRNRAATNHCGVVLGVYIYRSNFVSAAELELHCRGFIGRSYLIFRLLYADLGCLSGGGKAAPCELQAGASKDADYSDF